MSLAVLATWLDGARVALCLVVALAFARLGRSSRDRLYHAFAAAFLLLALNWSLLGLDTSAGDASVLAFLPRLLGFLVIIAAIVDKNRRSRSGGSRPARGAARRARRGARSRSAPRRARAG